MRLLDFAEHLAEAFDIKALGDDYLKQAAAVDPNAEYKPRMLVTPEAAKAELARRSGTAPATVPGTLKAGDGSTVVSGDGTPVQAGTQAAPAPAPTPTPAPADNSVTVGDPIPDPQVTATTLPAATPAAAPAPKQWAKGVLGMGSTGPEVEALQKRLGLKADGKFGPATRDAVIALQKKLGIKADGAYGPQTKAADIKATPQDSQKVNPDGAPATDPAGTGDAAAIANAANAPTLRYKTPAEYDKEIARFSATSDPKLPPNARYIAALQAEKAQLANPQAKPKTDAATLTAMPSGVNDYQNESVQESGFTNDELNRLVSLVHYR